MASTRGPASGLVDITDREFELFRRLILEESGISLSEHKRPLLCARLGRRLRQLSLSSYTAYYEYLRTRDETRAERRELINSITTNKTNFFRESHHFDFLRERVLEPLARAADNGDPRRLRIWSAACSTGEEPYSIAMTVAGMLSPLADWDIRILASDIDTDVLARAERGVYPREAAEDIPLEYRRRWCELSGNDEFTVSSEVRQLVTFREINFVREPWPIRVRFDVIFCRNVMIYFDRDKQTRIYTKFHELLRPNGYLIAGHSENLMFMAPLFEPMGNTVYKRRKTGRSRASMSMAAAAPAPSARRPAAEAKSVRSLPARASGSAMEPRAGGQRASLVPRARFKASQQPSPSGLPRSGRGARQSQHPRDGREHRVSARPGRRSLRPRVSVQPKGRAKAPSLRPRASATPKVGSRAPSPRPGASAAPKVISRRSDSLDRTPPMSQRRLGAAPPPSSLLLNNLPDGASAALSISLGGVSSARFDGPPMAATTPPAGLRDGLARKRIQSGEVFASSSPALVSTLLGSCVAACVFDAGRGVGGMNHFMLPSGDVGGAWNAMCFGTNAMELLINELLHLGARRGHLTAHVFGAAHVLGAGVKFNVAQGNERFIRDFLAREHIALLTQVLGGEQPLQVSFETHTGRVSAKAIGEKSAEVAEADARLQANLERQERLLDDGVTLF